MSGREEIYQVIRVNNLIFPGLFMYASIDWYY